MHPMHSALHPLGYSDPDCVQGIGLCGESLAHLPGRLMPLTFVDGISSCIWSLQRLPSTFILQICSVSI